MRRQEELSKVAVPSVIDDLPNRALTTTHYVKPASPLSSVQTHQSKTLTYSHGVPKADCGWLNCSGFLYYRHKPATSIEVMKLWAEFCGDGTLTPELAKKAHDLRQEGGGTQNLRESLKNFTDSELIIVAPVAGLAYAERSLVVQNPSLDRSINSGLAQYEFQHYAALGDSYAAGINADPNGRLPLCNKSNRPHCTSWACGKSYGSYPWQVHQSHLPSTHQFDFFACSGAATRGCLNQISKLQNSTDLVTINIGGNDDGAFGSCVSACIYFFNPSQCEEALDKASQTISEIIPRLSEVVRAAKAKAPSAKIAILSYIKFWLTKYIESQCQTEPLKNPSAAQRATMNSLVQRLNDALKTVADQELVDFLLVDPYFEKHRMCDVDEPWFHYDPLRNSTDDVSGGDYGGDDDGDDDPSAPNAPVGPGVFHPIVAGYRMYVQALSDYYGCGWDPVNSVGHIDL